ncbi:hypothetical protein [Kitasatospora sp. NPDC086791]|uniref:hypothetical protein n=1 Tax=Kitasatospora sp. NPDC086791 TaxID=3155178 RepID=UPI003437087B
MSTKRSWSNLPGPELAAVLEHTGEIRRATAVSEGMNSAVACVVEAEAGTFFVKATTKDHPYARLATEAAVNPYVVPLSPRMRWRIDTDRWDVLGFDYAPGRPADLSPDSPDLPMVAAAVTRLGSIRIPPRLLRPVQELFFGTTDVPELASLEGNSVTHGDLNPHNFRIADTARIVDWASPTLAAPWVELAFLIIRLIDAGHTPKSANAWARQFACWREAPPNAVAVHARMIAEQWHRTVKATDRAWSRSMSKAADQWVRHVLGGEAAGVGGW